MKDKLGKEAVSVISEALSTVYPDFSQQEFIEQATQQLGQKELKERVTYLIDVLSRFLPDDFTVTATYLVKLPSVWPKTETNDDRIYFAAWPLIDYIAIYGLEQPELALDVLAQLTELFSAEFAIRPFIEQHFDQTYACLIEWTQHDNPHVRRLASEGIRTRLPWATQLQQLRQQPSPIFSVLERLIDDSSAYVRKSVANNLNDLSKDHPELVLAWCESRIDNASEEAHWIINHGLRTLIKAGDQSAMAILGFKQARLSVDEFSLSHHQICLGDSLTLTLSLSSQSTQSQALLIDYKVHHQKANGKLTSKVFKWKRINLPAKQTLSLTKSHDIKLISTRRYYPGHHRIELMINGQTLEQSEFELTV